MAGPKMIQWWKNGDHPRDKSVEVPLDERTDNMTSFLTEGQAVTFNETDHPHDICIECGAALGIHGRAGQTLVHPGDWVSANKVKKGSGRGYIVDHPTAEQQARRTLEAAGVDLTGVASD
jgi:hypothetical protein